MRIREDKLLHLLQAKRSEDPEGFRKYLPEVEQLLCDLLDSPPKIHRTFSAVDGQPSPYEESWWEAVQKLAQGNITTLEAVGGLEACANLLLDNPYSTAVNYEPVLGLFQKVTDKSPDSYESETTIKLRNK